MLLVPLFANGSNPPNESVTGAAVVTVAVVANGSMVHGATADVGTGSNNHELEVACGAAAPPLYTSPPKGWAATEGADVSGPPNAPKSSKSITTGGGGGGGAAATAGVVVTGRRAADDRGASDCGCCCCCCCCGAEVDACVDACVAVVEEGGL